MRGKKTDAEFVSDFIVRCAKRGITNPQKVAHEAELQIAEIDEKIKEVEQLKKRRSKLVDVISSLGDKVKDNSEDKKALSFYQLSDLKAAAHVATQIQYEPCNAKHITTGALLIKEMLLAKILRRTGEGLELLAQGDEYHSFLDFCHQNGYRA